MSQQQPMDSSSTPNIQPQHPTMQLDDQLDAIPTPVDPLLTRLKQPAVEFPPFSNADLNDWVSYQGSLSSDQRFKSSQENIFLQKEIDLVQEEIQKVSAQDDGEGDIDLVQLFARVINTHPHIQHITYPIPKFFSQLIKQVCVRQAAPLTPQIEAFQRRFNELNTFLGMMRHRADSLADADEGQLENYFRQLGDDGLDLNFYRTIQDIVSSGQGQKIGFLTQQGGSTPSILAINESSARKLLDEGLMALSKGKFIPASQQDLQIEISTVNANLLSLQNEISKLKQQKAELSNGQYSSLGEDYNPYLHVTKDDLNQVLNRITTICDLYPITIDYYSQPVLDMNEKVMESSRPTPIAVKTASLNHGFGFFFQLDGTADPTINASGSSNRLNLGAVTFEAVSDGAYCYDEGVDLKSIQPKNNMEKAIEDKKANVPFDNFSTQPTYPHQETWFRSPLLDDQFQTEVSVRPKQSAMMSVLSGGQQSAETATKMVYNFSSSATYSVNVNENFTTTNDTGGIVTKANDFLLSILRTLTPQCTHFTVRLYFNSIRETLSELVNAFNDRGNSSQTPGVPPPLFPKDVPLSGLFNQGVTCYLNTYLQALYGLPYLRKALFYIPVTQPEEDSSPEAVYTPLCTHIDQCVEGETTTSTTNQPLKFIPPAILAESVKDDTKWSFGRPPVVDQRYCMSLREHILRSGRVGKHVNVNGIQEVDQDQVKGKGSKKIVKNFVYKKIVEHLSTPNTVALQALFLKMQTAAGFYLKHLYSNDYQAIVGIKPQSVMTSQTGKSSHGVCAQTTNEMTQSFLSKQFGWRRSQLSEQQDLQELARKVTDNLEHSTYNTIVEGVTQRLFKGYYQNVTRAINVDFTKVTEEAYEDLILPVLECNTLADSFKAYQVEDEISGYKTDHPEHGVQTVKRGQRLTDKLPPILTLMLKRMDFDYTTFEQTKINTRLEFPPVLDMSFVHKAARQDNQIGVVTSNTSTPSTSSTPQPSLSERLTIDQQVDEYGIDLDAYDGALNFYDSPLSPAGEAAKHCSLHGDQSLIYDLYSVLVHAGNINSGHYINFIRPLRSTQSIQVDDQKDSNGSYQFPLNRFQATGSQFFENDHTNSTSTDTTMNDNIDALSLNENNNQIKNNNQVKMGECTCNFDHSKADFYRQGDWYCFDDHAVTLSTAKEAIDDNYGSSTTNRYNAGKSAYLLMYINRKYTYHDTTNNANELVFHPAVFSQIGQQLLPASALPPSAIPTDKINQIIPSVDEQQQQIVNQKNNIKDDKKSPTTPQAANLDVIDPNLDQFDSIFAQMDHANSKLLDTINNERTKQKYEGLARLQDIRKNDSGFIDIYPPLPLRRLLAQTTAVKNGTSRWNQPLPPPPMTQVQQQQSNFGTEYGQMIGDYSGVGSKVEQQDDVTNPYSNLGHYGDYNNQQPDQVEDDEAHVNLNARQQHAGDQFDN